MWTWTHEGIDAAPVVAAENTAAAAAAAAATGGAGAASLTCSKSALAMHSTTIT